MVTMIHAWIMADLSPHAACMSFRHSLNDGRPDAQDIGSLAHLIHSITTMSQKLCRDFSALGPQTGRPATSTMALGEFFAKS
jgi:hypothetical protein